MHCTKTSGIFYYHSTSGSREVSVSPSHTEDRLADQATVSLTEDEHVGKARVSHTDDRQVDEVICPQSTIQKADVLTRHVHQAPYPQSTTEKADSFTKPHK